MNEPLVAALSRKNLYPTWDSAYHAKWNGASGKGCLHCIYPIWDIPAHIRNVNFIFTKIIGTKWVPLYIGQSDELDERIDRHEKLLPAIRMGATHCHIHFSTSRPERFAIEIDLLRAHYTPLNAESSPGTGARSSASIAPRVA